MELYPHDCPAACAIGDDAIAIRVNLASWSAGAKHSDGGEDPVADSGHAQGAQQGSPLGAHPHHPRHGIVASMASRVIVMYGGRIVESGKVLRF